MSHNFIFSGEKQFEYLFENQLKFKAVFLRITNCTFEQTKLLSKELSCFFCHNFPEELSN